MWLVKTGNPLSFSTRSSLPVHSIVTGFSVAFHPSLPKYTMQSGSCSTAPPAPFPIGEVPEHGEGKYPTCDIKNKMDSCTIMIIHG